MMGFFFGFSRFLSLRGLGGVELGYGACLPAFDEGVALARGDHMVGNDLPVHNRHSNLIRRRFILQLRALLESCDLLCGRAVHPGDTKVELREKERNSTLAYIGQH